MISSDLVRLRQTLKTTESSGVLHEDTLLELGVISQKEYDELCNMENRFGSVLPSWLGLESNRILSAMTKYVQRNSKPLHQTQSSTSAEPALVEDEYDQEDIEEIQRELKINKLFMKDLNILYLFQQVNEWWIMEIGQLTKMMTPVRPTRR